MRQPDDPHARTLRSFAQSLLTLDAMAHHYGRTVDRHENRPPAEWFSTGDGAFARLAGVAHSVLMQNMREPDFEAEVHRLIKDSAQLARRRYRRRDTAGPKPPLPTVALAIFVQQHQGGNGAAPCFPWWWPGFKPEPGDELPDVEPYGG